MRSGCTHLIIDLLLSNEEQQRLLASASELAAALDYPVLLACFASPASLRGELVVTLLFSFACRWQVVANC